MVILMSGPTIPRNSKLIAKKLNGIYLSVLGEGSGNVNDAIMEALADHGNGNYNFIDTICRGEKVPMKSVWYAVYGRYAMESSNTI